MMHIRLDFMLPFTIISLLLIISWKVCGYAEVHYKFFNYSLLSRKHPEILVDVPWRVDMGNNLPVACIVKDSDRFPIRLKRITARCRINGGAAWEESLFGENLPIYISDHYWSMCSSINLPNGVSGNLEARIEIEYRRNGIKNVITSDNFTGLSHAPFKVFISPSKLPSFNGWYYGDAHYHSDMTHDQAEYGAPTPVATLMGKAIGLSWLVVSDHSYDLDRVIGEYFDHDSKLNRWQKLRMDANSVNSEDNDFFVLPAEEISCGNCKSRNIHLLAINTPQFIPGSGDGVKRGLNKRPDLTLRQCINRINQLGGYAYAAHPEIGNGFMGTLLLNRDRWRDPDYAQGGYSGLEFWNGTMGKEFDKAYKKWVKLLLEGRKLFILGGNDAHGDFNRSRRVKYPTTKLTEDNEHVFGRTRTYAYCGDDFSLDGIHESLKNGRTVVTNGPVAIMDAENMSGEKVIIGGDIAGREFVLTINARSSAEYGPIEKLTLYRGNLTDEAEQIEKTFIPKDNKGIHTFTHKISHKNRGYVRVEATSSVRDKSYLCITNPIWFRPA